MLSIFPADRFTETRWRNGQGLAWEIASEPPGAAADNFDWRFAIARINGDAPFSHYPGIDRIFTLTAGNGVDLTVEGQGTLTVHERFVPHRFPGDAATSCHIDSGPCMALNLFLRRGRWRAEIKLLRDRGIIDHGGTTLLFALEGNVGVGNQTLSRGDAARTEGTFPYRAGGGLLYAAQLDGSG